MNVTTTTIIITGVIETAMLITLVTQGQDQTGTGFIETRITK